MREDRLAVLNDIFNTVYCSLKYEEFFLLFIFLAPNHKPTNGGGPSTKGVHIFKRHISLSTPIITNYSQQINLYYFTVLKENQTLKKLDLTCINLLCFSLVFSWILGSSVHRLNDIWAFFLQVKDCVSTLDRSF